jgi:hypothetical protein
MNEFSQVATAMLAIAFAALMLLVGELYIQRGPVLREGHPRQ